MRRHATGFNREGVIAPVCRGTKEVAPGPSRTAPAPRLALGQRAGEAEGEGFEPSVTYATPVFKTGAIGRSATPPKLPQSIIGSTEPVEKRASRTFTWR